MASATVKWFIGTKGFGFFTPGAGLDDFFAHLSAVQRQDFKTLKAGQRVGFDLAAGSKGRLASNIRAADQSRGRNGMAALPCRSP